MPLLPKNLFAVSAFAWFAFTSRKFVVEKTRVFPPFPRNVIKKPPARRSREWLFVFKKFPYFVSGVSSGLYASLHA